MIKKYIMNRFFCLLFGCLSVLTASVLQADSYQSVESPIHELIRSQGTATPLFNESNDGLLKLYYQTMPSISYVAREQLKLGGLRFNPQNYTSISNSYINKIIYLNLVTQKETEIKFKDQDIIRQVQWSPSGHYIAITVEQNLCHELWIYSVQSNVKSKVPQVCLNSVSSRGLSWLNLKDELIIKVRTQQQKNGLIQTKITPNGPVTFDSKGIVSQNRTYPDLLKNKSDFDLFEKALMSEYKILRVDHKVNFKIQTLFKPYLYAGIEFSPDENYILVSRYKKPFSMSVPLSLFAISVDIYHKNLKLVHHVYDGGPFESLPIQGVRTGSRQFDWVNSEPATLIFAEAQDQGDWNKPAEYRDYVYKQSIEKHKILTKVLIAKLRGRYLSTKYFQQKNKYFISEYQRDTEWITSSIYTQLPSSEDFERKEIFSYSENDDYKNPGEPLLEKNIWHQMVIGENKIVKEPHLFMSGNGASKDGDRPFIRLHFLNSMQSKELFRSDLNYFEDVFEVIDVKNLNIVFSQESQLQPPHYFKASLNDVLRKVLSEGEGPSSDGLNLNLLNQKKLIIKDSNDYELLSKVKKEMITYQRSDGVKLSGLLYYPLNYEKEKKYPLVIQAYPLEYTDASVAGQVRGSSNKYEAPFREAMIYHALRGYFVLDEAQMPIIGTPEKKNDTFIPQLLSGAQAAIDALDRRQYIDRDRVGVMGHSYGAFMVSHLLTHSSMFKAGIAKSGAYNRSLTPFGFQGERRTFWQAKDTYIKMSTFMDADKMKTPLLLIHGMNDNNSGTFTIQSERYFEALKGQGAPARLVLLPEESHGYAALESVEHTMYEMFKWFDENLKKKSRQ